MTEEEWLNAADTELMFDFIKSRKWKHGVWARKLTLARCYLFREKWESVPNEFRSAVISAEEWQDQNPSPRQIRWVRRGFEKKFPDSGFYNLATEIKYLIDHIEKPNFDLIRHRLMVGSGPVLLRDVFGNPFRPVAFDPSWRTSNAVALAQTMYDARNFHAMPILADALQDAGCEDAAILDHCRDANAIHVRGCWVVDLVLGKA